MQCRDRAAECEYERGLRLQVALAMQDKRLEEARMLTLQQMTGKAAEGYARTRSGVPKFRFVFAM